MYNREVISRLAKQLDELFERKELNGIVEALAQVIADTLNEGETINLSTLGKFTLKIQPARRYYNIHKKRREECKEKRIVIFTPSKGLLESRATAPKS